MMADKQRLTRLKVRGSQVATFSDDLWDITDIERGATLAEWFKDGVKIIIKRGGASFCVYLGVSADHPLAGFDYDSIPIECHGGLTFASEGTGDYLPKGFYFYGWDYAHAGDYTDFYKGVDGLTFADDKKWTLGEVKKDIEWNGLWDFKKLMSLAERIDLASTNSKPPQTHTKSDVESAIKLFQAHQQELLSEANKVDRFEVIDDSGRAYVKGSVYGSPVSVRLDYQDDNRTLKVFVTSKTNDGGTE